MKKHGLVCSLKYEFLTEHIGQELLKPYLLQMANYVLAQSIKGDKLKTLVHDDVHQLKALSDEDIPDRFDLSRLIDAVSLQIENIREGRSILDGVRELSLPEYCKFHGESPMLGGAKKMDEGKSKKYWSTPCEMFARAMEAWVNKTSFC